MAVGKGVNPGPSVPTKAPRGNARTSIGQPARTPKNTGGPPASRQAPPPQADSPTRTPRGKGIVNIGSTPVSAPQPQRVAPGAYGQPNPSRGTVGAGRPSSVTSAPPQKKGSPAVVGGGTVGKPVTGTMLNGMKKGPVLQKGAPAATRMRLGKRGT